MKSAAAFFFVIAFIAITCFVSGGVAIVTTTNKKTSFSSSETFGIKDPALVKFVKGYAYGDPLSPKPITEEAIVAAFSFEAKPDQIPWQIESNKSKYLTHEWVQRNQVDEVDGSWELTTAPRQIHIAMMNDDHHEASSFSSSAGNSVSVSWTTSQASTNSEVCWRQVNSTTTTNNVDDDNHWSCRNGTSWTYHPISVIPWKGSLHRGNITNLVPGQSYEYYVGDPILKNFSSPVVFTAPSPRAEDVLIFLGGDMGSVQLFGHDIASQMRRDEQRDHLKVDAFWLVGDIAYSTLDPPKLNFEFFWDVYMQQEESLANHVPFHVSYGNHDFSGGDSGAYINRFAMPQGYQGNANFYWAYRHGPILYVSMCTEVGLNPANCDYAPGSAQYKWLEQTFGSINRTETPWLVLAGHRPMYSSDKSTDSGRLQMYIEPLLKQYNVDVQIAGHMHDTEIISPVMDNEANLTGVTQTTENGWKFDNPGAPVHLTVGNLGAVIREEFFEPQPKWSLFRNGTFWDNCYGYTQLRANATSLHFKNLKTSDNGILWELEISKK